VNGSDQRDADGVSFAHAFAARVGIAGGELTANDVRVTQYLRDHLERLPFLAADEVAAAVGVSRAAVVRLARKLGYPTFTALRDDARRQFHEMRQSPMARFSGAGPDGADDGGAGAAKGRRKFEADVANLEATWSMIAARLDPAVGDLARARLVLIAGNRNSFGLATYFHRLLRGVRGGCHLLDPGFPDEVADLTAEDVLVIVLFRRYSAGSIRLIEWAARTGARTIAITDSESQPFLRDVTHVLPVVTGSPLLYDSMVGTVAVLEALAEGAADAMPGEAARLLAVKEQLTAEGSVFHRPLNPRGPGRNSGGGQSTPDDQENHA
jgi:DNA-binding MurR/RpiR family transcriptional regulator